MDEVMQRAAARLESDEMLDSINARVATLGLDLGGLTVLTEAATGAYASTAVIAALGGARRVCAIARDTARHGSARDAANATHDLARRAGVEARVEVLEQLGSSVLASCDILTNSGHLRPITRAMIERLPPNAVIALMFEAWEFRSADLDLDACRERGIRVAAVNERHPDVAVFPFLGPLCVRLLEEAGTHPAGRRIALLCDNPFAPFLCSGLEAAGAEVRLFAGACEVEAGGWDVVVVATGPAPVGPLGAEQLGWLSAAAPGALIAQFWGNIDRKAARELGLSLAPAVGPGPGHMGILLNSLGFEPIVRLQTGALRAAELVFRGAALPEGGVAEILW